MILTSAIPVGLSPPLTRNCRAIRGLLPIMQQWSIWEQKAAHNLQTGYPQDKASHLPWWEALKTTAEAYYFDEGLNSRNWKGRKKPTQEVLHIFKSHPDIIWLTMKFMRLNTLEKKKSYLPNSLGKLSCTKIQTTSYSPCGTITNAPEHTRMGGSPNTEAAKLWTSWAAPNFRPASQAVFLWLHTAVPKKQLAWVQSFSCKPLRWVQGFWCFLSTCWCNSTCQFWFPLQTLTVSKRLPVKSRRWYHIKDLN